MADNRIIQNGDASRISDAICIDTKRIYDSCVSKDCLENLRVTFHERSQCLIDEALLVKCRDCEIVATVIDLEEVPFNRGFYSVDITYYFKLKFDTFKCVTSNPQTAVGFALFTKKCILYGSDGNVKIFSSHFSSGEFDEQNMPQYTNPYAKVQVVDPVVLSCDVVDCCECRIPCCCCFPRAVTADMNDCIPSPEKCKKAVLVTLGLFSIVQIERDVQVLIPAYDYCVPEHECCCDSENPCDTFGKINFPVDEFFPKDNKNNHCPCCEKPPVEEE